MAQVSRVQCCAILELHGLHQRVIGSGIPDADMIKNLLMVLFQHYVPAGALGHQGGLPAEIYSRPYIILSYARNMHGGLDFTVNGKAFISWVEKNDMGKLTVTEPNINPSSKSDMIFILWQPHHDNLRKYFQDTFVAPAWKKKMDDETLAAKVKAENDRKAAEKAKEASAASIPGKKPAKISGYYDHF